MAGHPAARLFLADRRGNFAIIFALCLAPIMALAGASVDYSRIRAAEDRLQDAADAGALAAATNGGTVARMQRLAEEFVRANAPDLDLSVKTIVNMHDLTVEASAILPLPVLSAFGKPQAILSITAQVESETPLKGPSIDTDAVANTRRVAELRHKFAWSTRRLPHDQRLRLTRRFETMLRASPRAPGRVRLTR